MRLRLRLQFLTRIETSRDSRLSLVWGADEKQIDLGLLNDSMAKVQAELRGWRSDDLSSMDSSDCENDIDDEIKARIINKTYLIMDQYLTKKFGQ